MLLDCFRACAHEYQKLDATSFVLDVLSLLLVRFHNKQTTTFIKSQDAEKLTEQWKLQLREVFQECDTLVLSCV